LRPVFLKQIEKPKIVFYNAGTDIYAEDLLGRLKVSEQGILERDRFVFQTVTELGIPIVMVLRRFSQKKVPKAVKS